MFIAELFFFFYYVTTDDVFLIIGLKCLFECDDDAGCDLFSFRTYATLNLNLIIYYTVPDSPLNNLLWLESILTLVFSSTDVWCRLQ